MLAVVEHEEAAAPGEVLGGVVQRRRARGGVQAEGVGQGARDVGAQADGRELAPPHAVGEAGGLAVGQLRGQARLPRPADAGDRDQRAPGEQVREARQVGLAPEEAAAACGEAADASGGRGAGRHVAREHGTLELADLLRGLEPELEQRGGVAAVGGQRSCLSA